MFEYLIIVGLAVVVIFAFLIYQKIGSKNKENTDEIGLSDIKERLGNIENAQQAIEKLNEKIIDFENIFNNKTKRRKAWRGVFRRNCQRYISCKTLFISTHLIK